MSEILTVSHSQVSALRVPFSPTAAGRTRPVGGWLRQDLMNLVLGLRDKFQASRSLPSLDIREAPEPQTHLVAQTASEMATIVVQRLGLPVTALSDILDVERKTIYDWWRGAQPGTANYERMRRIQAIFDGQPDGSGRFYHRFWKLALADGSNLREILVAENLDVDRARRALDELRPSVETAIASDRVRGSVSYAPASAANFLSDFREVGPRD